ncbi:hypothetical protein C6P78_17155 [Burkholderia multivorans]|nr:hypothetical protein C6P78_17155 [Burkholderia multivorans]
MPLAGCVCASRRPGPDTLSHTHSAAYRRHPPPAHLPPRRNQDGRPPTAAEPAIPHTVWALALVSLYIDRSSALIHALPPIYLMPTMERSVAALSALRRICCAAPPAGLSA